MKVILAITSYQGDTTTRFQTGGEQAEYTESLSAYPGDTLYAVVDIAVLKSGWTAEIIDDGYRSYDEAKAAWPEAS